MAQIFSTPVPKNVQNCSAFSNIIPIRARIGGDRNGGDFVRSVTHLRTFGNCWEKLGFTYFLNLSGIDIFASFHRAPMSLDSLTVLHKFPLGTSREYQGANFEFRGNIE